MECYKFEQTVPSKCKLLKLDNFSNDSKREKNTNDEIYLILFLLEQKSPEVSINRWNLKLLFTCHKTLTSTISNHWNHNLYIYSRKMYSL